MNVEEIPSCCVRTLREMERILTSFDALSGVIAIAPGLAQPRPRGIALGITGVMTMLWILGMAAYRAERGRMRGQLDRAARARVADVVTLHIALDHPHGALHDHWVRILEGFEN
jgi:dihydroxyacetone kinase